MKHIWAQLEQLREKVQALKADVSAEQRGRLAAKLEVVACAGRKREEDYATLLREVELVLSCTGVRRVQEMIMDAVIRLSGAGVPAPVASGRGSRNRRRAEHGTCLP